MSSPPTAVVTAQGVRDGDRMALTALVERRGAAVLAYCEAVAEPGRGLEAAGEALARFRREVRAAAEPRALDPEVLLLRATRRAAAARAPKPEEPRGLVARRLGATCPLVPELLAVRADGNLTAADRLRQPSGGGRPATAPAPRRARGRSPGIRRMWPQPPPHRRGSATGGAWARASPCRRSSSPPPSSPHSPWPARSPAARSRTADRSRPRASCRRRPSASSSARRPRRCPTAVRRRRARPRPRARRRPRPARPWPRRPPPPTPRPPRRPSPFRQAPR